VAPPLEQHVGVDAMLACQTGNRYARFACLLRQAALEIKRMIGPPFAGRHRGFFGQFGSRYLFDGNYFGSSKEGRPDGRALTLTAKGKRSPKKSVQHVCILTIPMAYTNRATQLSDAVFNVFAQTAGFQAPPDEEIH
jgi:hypothetical protein